MILFPEKQNGNNTSRTVTSEDLVSDIQETRASICNTFLVTISLIAIPALAASLYRITEVGWQPIMIVHIVLAIFLWSIFFFRRRIPYNFQAGFIVILFFVIGLGGMLQFGLVAGGTVFLVASSPIATLLFGGRIGAVTMILSFCSAVMVGLLTVTHFTHYFENRFDLISYVDAPSAWLSSIIGWGLTSTALTVSIFVFNKSLIKALKTSRQHQLALFDHHWQLKKTIEERDSVNNELQKALEEIKTLRGILPICSYCHSIRDDEGIWNKIENYLSTHSEAKLTHGICPKCMDRARAEAGLDKK